MHVYPSVFVLAGTARSAIALFKLLSSWSQAVRDKEFLVEMRLKNHEPNGERAESADVGFLDAEEGNDDESGDQAQGQIQVPQVVAHEQLQQLQQQVQLHLQALQQQQQALDALMPQVEQAEQGQETDDEDEEDEGADPQVEAETESVENRPSRLAVAAAASKRRAAALDHTNHQQSDAGAASASGSGANQNQNDGMQSADGQ